MRYYLTILCAGFIAVSSFAYAQDIPESVSLNESIRQALAYSPKLKAKLENIGGSRGERLQSALIPNPEILFEAENILGSGSANGLRGGELTLGVAQPLELGGKREARINAADRQLDLASLEFAAASLDIIREATIAWAEAAAAFEELQLAEKQSELATEILSSVSRRVDAAAENSIQKSKAEVALASSKIALAKAERNKSASIKALTGLWGGAPASFSFDTSDFFNVERPEFSEIENTALSNPDLKIIEAEVGIAKASLNKERTLAIPDITLQAGVRDSRDSKEQSFLAGVSIPFPVFNRNQGSILKAGHEVTKAEHEKAAAMNVLDLSLIKAKNAQEIAYSEISSLEKNILPSAEKAFTQARKAYRAGRFSYLEVLDAQRTLSEVQLQRINALKDYHAAKADIDRLTGKYINLVNLAGEKQ